MIHPRMATMLSIVLTDATAAPGHAHALLRPAAAATWNQLSVDGDTSTNDTVFLLASGAAGAAPADGRARRPRPCWPRPSRRWRATSRASRPRRRGRHDAASPARSRAPPTTPTPAPSPARSISSPGQGRGPRPRPQLGPHRRSGRQRARRRGGRPGGRRPAGRRGRGARRPARGGRPRPPADRDRRPPRLRRRGGRPGRRRQGRGPATMDAAGRPRPPRPGAGRRHGRGVRLRPHGAVRARELGVHDVSEILVVKLGGTTLADQRQVLEEVAAVARQRPVVLVHGGGKRITEWLERLGRPDPVRGRPARDGPRGARGGRRGPAGRRQQRAGRRACGMPAATRSGCPASTAGCSSAERVPDLGLVATVVGVRRDLLDALLVAGQVPVVAPLARDEDGIVCNVNADDAAAGIAAGLGARQLVLMTDVDGVRDAAGNRLDSIDARGGRGADRRRHDPRRHGAQGPGGPGRPHLGGRRGDHRRRSAPGCPGPGARRPDASAPASRRRPRRDRARRWHRGDGREARPPAAIRRLVAGAAHRQPGRAGRRALGARLRGHAGHRQPRHRGAGPGQGDARRPRTSTSSPRPSAPRAAARRRAPAPDPRRHPGHDRPERPDPRADGPAGHRQRHRPGDR